MSPTEYKILEALADEGYEGFCYWSFDALCRRTQLERRVVRHGCRSLARKGFAEFGKGLWNEEGKPAGSGYAATRAGAAALAQTSCVREQKP